MKNATILSLLCVGLLCALLVLLATRENQGTATLAAEEPTLSASPALELPTLPGVETEGRDALEATRAENEEKASPEKRPRRGKEPGVLRGHVVDVNGNRLPSGRVQLFHSQSDLEPAGQADVEGVEREYRFSLQAGEAYYVAVEPASVVNFGVPPFYRGFTRARRDLDGSILLNEYTRVRVVVKEGETLRLDLPIARLGDVTGRLLDERGLPMPKIIARVAGLDRNSYGSMQDATTDQHGVFRHHHLFPGAHRLTFLRPVTPEGLRLPLPLDFALADGESLDLGDIQVQPGTCSIVGAVVDQDGRPFSGLPIVCYPSPSGDDQKPPPGLGNSVRRTRSRADGSFELDELPTCSYRVSLTPDYEPNQVVAGQPAFWEHPIEVHLTHQRPRADIGVHVVHESRPFRLEGHLLEKVPGTHRRLLRASVSQIGKASPTESEVRRTGLDRKPVKLDWETGTFELLVETPRPEIELRFELEGHEDLVFVVQPEPWGVWAQDVSIPFDFEPRE